MSPAEEKRLRALVVEPLFRCAGGWRRGERRISLKTAAKLIGLGLAEQRTSRRGTPMLVAKSKPAKTRPPENAWWVE